MVTCTHPAYLNLHFSGATMSPKAREELLRKLLAAYVEELQAHRTLWAMPADRTTHLNAWAAARAKVDPKGLRK